MILNVDRIHVVTKVEVHEPTAGLVLATRKGHYAVHDDLYQGGLLTSIDNAPMGLREPRKTVDDELVIQMAVYAAYWMRGHMWKSTNQSIRELTIADIRSKPIPMKDWYAGRRYILDFTKLKTYQVYMWLYHVFVILFRLGSITAPKKDNFIHITMARIWWRDMVVMLLHHLNVDFSIKMKKTAIEVTMTRREFHRMLSRMLRAKFPKKASDFDFVDAVVTKSCVILDTNGEIDIDDGVDVPDEIQQVEVMPKMSEFRNIFISFPEIDCIIEANGLIL